MDETVSDGTCCASAAGPVVIGRTDDRGRVTLGGTTRTIVPVSACDLDSLVDELEAQADACHDLLEWRVDPLLAALGGDESSEADELLAGVHRALGQVLARAGRPVLATVRTGEEGGAVNLSPAVWAQVVTFLAGSVDAVDVEIMRDGAAEVVSAAHSAGAGVVASFHDFHATPGTDDLRRIFTSMAEAGADVLKVACMPSGASDVLRLLEAQVWARTELARPVIGIAMGEVGVVSRVVGAHFGQAATFATLGARTAPGQLPLSVVRDVLAVTEGCAADS